MDQLHISASSKQLSRLRNGHKVRVKPAMKGAGYNLIVDPSTYSAVSNIFSKGKGATIQLSPPEIMANKAASAEMKGMGIFGPAVDKWLEKKGIKKAVYKIGDQLKPAAKTALLGAIASGATALGASNPALIPYLPAGVAGASSLALDYIDNPDSYFSSNAGGSRARKARSLIGRMAEDKALSEINAQLGTNMGSLDRASLEQAVANKYREKVADDRFASTPALGMGLYAGQGLGLGIGGERGIRRSAGSIGIGGTIMRGGALIPALQSQPYSANFQFRRTFPPQFQQK